MRRVAWLPANLDACSLYRMFVVHMRMPGSIFMFHQYGLDMTPICACDVAVVQRLCTESNYRALKTMKQLGLKLVYDLDDNMWAIPAYNPAYQLFKELEPGFRICAAECDLITVSTHPLLVAVRAAIGKGCPPIEVINNTMDMEWFSPVSQELRRNSKNGAVVVGWAGTNTHTGDVAEVFALLPKMLERFPQLELEFAGLPAPDMIKNHPRVRQRDFVPIAEWPARWASWQWDVALAPLDDNKFNRSKCMSGNTQVFGLVNGHPRRTFLSTFLRQSGDKHLPGMDGSWRKVTAYEKMPIENGFSIHVRGGDFYHVTKDHCFMLSDGSLVPARDLKVGDTMKTTRICVQQSVSSLASIATYETGWFIGQYLSDGSIQKNDKLSGKRGGLACIGVAIDSRKEELRTRLEAFGKAWGANTGFSHPSGNKSTVIFYEAHALLGLINQFCTGVDSYTKHLKRAAWRQSREFLRGIVDGWLDGDGHRNDERWNTWTFGITRNWNLLRDIQLACNLAGYQIRYNRTFATNQTGKTFKIIHGSIRKTSAYYQSVRDNGEIMQITQIPVSTYAVEVDGDHIFVLPSGVVTHNSNIKFLEAAALGIPCIGSDVAPYHDFCRSSRQLKEHLLCRKPLDWERKIEAIITNRSLRTSLGMEMNRVAREEYDVSRSVARWTEIAEAL